MANTTNASVTDVLAELYSAPLDAAVAAEQDYRRIWRDWLTFKRGLLVDNSGNLKAGVQLADLIETAPIVSINGRIEMAFTMRIVSANETKGGGGAGLGLGPIQVGGSFGFVSRTTQESVLQASTVVTMSNSDQNLSDYLTRNGIPVTDVGELDQAIALLTDQPDSGNGGDGNGQG